MKNILAVVAGVAGLVFVLSAGAAADKPASGAPASAKPATSAAPATAAAATGGTGFPTAPVAPPKVGPEHEVLKWWAGNWTCKGSAEASPMGPAHPVEGTMKSKLIWAGMFLTGDWKEKKTKENPFPGEGKMTMGYDLNAKHYTSHWMSTWGEQMMSASKGWDGDKWVWTAEGVMGPGSKWIETDTKVSDKEFNMTMEIVMGGKTLPAGTFNCKKP